MGPVLCKKSMSKLASGRSELGHVNMHVSPGPQGCGGGHFARLGARRWNLARTGIMSLLVFFCCYFGRSCFCFAWHKTGSRYAGEQKQKEYSTNASEQNS